MHIDDGWEIQIEAYRRMTPEQRLQIGFDLCRLARDLSRAGIRHQHPDWNDEQVEREVARRSLLGAGLSPDDPRLPRTPLDD